MKMTHRGAARGHTSATRQTRLRPVSQHRVTTSWGKAGARALDDARRGATNQAQPLLEELLLDELLLDELLLEELLDPPILMTFQVPPKPRAPWPVATRLRLSPA